MTRILKIDKINIELVNGKIRLRWTFKGERLSLSVGNSSEENLDIARARAYQINSEIMLGKINPDDYRSKSKKIIVPQQSIKSEIRLIDLWEMFLKDKIKSGLKETSIAVYLGIDRIIHKLGNGLSYDAFDVKERLEKITTVDQTKSVLRKLSSCCEEGIKRKLITENNFNGMWEYLPDTPIKEPYCFSDAEIEQILNNFSTHKSHRRHYDLIIFWLNTGCRPSEALGVKWGDLDDDFSQITFRGSPQGVNGKGITWSEGSKTFKKGRRSIRGKTRTIPLNSKLKEVLEKRVLAKTYDTTDLIYPNQEGGYLRYSDFRRRAWKDCVKSIDGLEEKIPYNLRDTFITRQLIKGVPIAVIAAWCDNSPSVIERRYADYVKLAMGSVTPYEI